MRTQIITVADLVTVLLREDQQNLVLFKLHNENRYIELGQPSEIPVNPIEGGSGQYKDGSHTNQTEIATIIELSDEYPILCGALSNSWRCTRPL